MGKPKKVNIAIFGVGQVGGALVDQILKAAPQIEKRKGIQLQIFAIANSSKMLLEAGGIDSSNKDWRKALKQEGQAQDIGKTF